MFVTFQSVILIIIIFSAVNCVTNNTASNSTQKSKLETQKTSNSTPVSSTFHYHLDSSWPHKSVSDLKVFGSSIAIGKDGNIILLHRGSNKKPTLISENTLAVIDKNTGKIIKEWGFNKFVEPHSVTVSENGGIFITDKVMHQIFKFEMNTTTKLWNEKPSIILGQAYEGAREDESHFCGPSDVAELSDTGEFFVSDGYCHSRVMKFDKTGKFLLQFGAGGTIDPVTARPKPFNVSHAVALAKRNPVKHEMNKTEGTHSHEDPVKFMLLVADRGNSRIQSFDLNGTFLYEISSKVFGAENRWVLSMATTNGKSNSSNYEFGYLYVIDGKVEVGQAKVFIFGLSRNNFTLITSFLISDPTISKPPSTIKTNGTTTTAPPGKAMDIHPHDIAVTKDGNEIYIVESVGNLIIRKYVQGEHKASQDKKGKSSSNPVTSPTRLISLIIFIGILLF